MTPPPCPFCGARNTVPHDDGAAHWALCANCGARGPVAWDADTARRRWERQPLRRGAWRCLRVLDDPGADPLDLWEAARHLRRGLAVATDGGPAPEREE